MARRYPQTKAAKRSLELLDELAQGSHGGDGHWGGIYLADLTPVQKHVGGDLEGRAVTMGRKRKQHSLWTRTSIPHPPATVEYVLGRQYSQLSGAVGIEDSAKADRTRVSTSFQIIGDGKVLWTSQPLREPGKTGIVRGGRLACQQFETPHGEQ